MPITNYTYYINVMVWFLYALTICRPDDQEAVRMRVAMNTLIPRYPLHNLRAMQQTLIQNNLEDELCTYCSQQPGRTIVVPCGHIFCSQCVGVCARTSFLPRCYTCDSLMLNWP